jgi:hypothetical protein
MVRVHHYAYAYFCRVVKAQLLAFQRNQKVLEEGKEGKHNV